MIRYRTIFFIFFHIMASRVVNTASPDQVAQLVSEMYTEADLKIIQDGNYEDFCNDHIEFLCRLLKQTCRPTPALIEESITSAIPGVSAVRASMFSKMVSSTISHYRRLAKSTKTGCKLSKPAARLAKRLKRARPGPKLHPAAKARRKLRPHSTQESTCSIEEVVQVKEPPVICDVPSSPEVIPASTPPDSAAAILAIYGVGSSSAAAATSAAATSAAATSAAASSSASSSTLQVLTPSGLRRHKPDGSTEVADMQPGPNGFMQAVFDGERPIETEMTNLYWEAKQNFKPKPYKPNGASFRMRNKTNPNRLNKKPAAAPLAAAPALAETSPTKKSIAFCTTRTQTASASGGTTQKGRSSAAAPAGTWTRPRCAGLPSRP